jgi:hypothetical protein
MLETGKPLRLSMSTRVRPRSHSTGSLHVGGPARRLDGVSAESLRLLIDILPVTEAATRSVSRRDDATSLGLTASLPMDRRALANDARLLEGAAPLPGLNDPDTQRRTVVWPMAASLGGLAALAVARTVFIGIPPGPGPWMACWLVAAALIASAGRPVRLAIGTPLDPKMLTASDQARRSARRARLLTLLTFAGGLAIGALLRPDLLQI